MNRLQTKGTLSLLLTALLITGSCKWDSTGLDKDVSKIPVQDVEVHRYDQALFSIPPDDLEDGLDKIKPLYPFFLDTDLRDSSRINNLKEYLTNIRTIEFYTASQERFKDMGGLEKELTEALRHLLYYYPDSKLPRVYSYISGGEYENPIQFVDSVLLIALDAYLGSGFKPYAADGLPLYKMVRMEPEFILPDCIHAMQEAYYPYGYPGNTLLDQMIDAGKRLYFVDAMIPGYAPRFKIKYTEEQMDWITANEAQVWAAIIENQLLYASQAGTIRTFLADGPFTADFSAESPPRLGEYIGWQIVMGYMEQHPELSLDELFREADSQKILSESKYKPKK